MDLLQASKAYQDIDKHYYQIGHVTAGTRLSRLL
jgi:hypothetical protein